jgi:glycosyltransferase involved in cell wall biosynthesis
MEVKLSICIATYNRARFLAQTLDNILPQLNEQCEVVVSDNASTDDTAQVVSEYAARWNNVRYRKQETNVGLDRNFDAAVEHARGEYCWLFADDDLLKADAVATILAALRPNLSLVLANWETRNISLSEVLSPGRFPGLEADRLYTPDQLDQLFQHIGSMIFIGCIIIRRELWMHRDRARYYGTLLLHLGVLFQAPMPGDTLIIARPLIINRHGNSRTFLAELFEVFARKLPAIVSTMAISDPVKNRYLDSVMNAATLIYYRALNMYSLHEYRRWIRPHTHCWRRRCVALLIAAVPGVISNAGMLFFFRHFSRDPLRKVKMVWLSQSGFHFHTWHLYKRNGASPRVG